MKFLSFLLLFATFVSAQNQYPKDFFRSPLDIPMQLSGNFGELRPNHFHAGFDFKTNQREGLNVYAAGDGYISRIKISTAGYGKAIYITHPNGYTTVYGHLQKAVGTIQDKIIQLQYVEKAYEIEAFFKPEDLPIKKGEIIALSGNTGGSEGPHLHFEFRDNKTEQIINPLFFGLNLKDTRSPTVSNLLVYPIDNNSVANESKRPVILNLSLQKDGTYLSEKVLATGKIGFGINASDTDDVSYNPNGVYKTQLIFNGKVTFGYEFNKMVFDEARYVNAFIDYFRYKKTHQRVQRLFMKQPFAWSNIYQNVDNGILNVTPNFMENERIEVSDFFENKTIINIPIEYSDKKSIVNEEVKPTKYFIKAKSDSNFEKDNVSVFFPAGTFYDDFYMNFDVRNNILFLHEDVVPAHTNFNITFEDTKSSEKDKKKMFIASVYGTKLSYNTTKLVGTTFSCKSKTLGQFTLVKDSIVPKITIAKSIDGKWLTDKKSIQLSVSDDLSGVKTINGYLNDKWVLFEYEPKTRKITHTFQDNLLLEGQNKLKVVVADNVGNSTIFETQFFRSQKK
ncbi:M23 family metallopeptidase [Flavobacterium sp. SUN052]|uniref:M23 family metallopeptidase n=1 Tax=Flavobacterium sp. SUN052 TaxID=3002441 RepID=UPI00237EC8FB|nr:M23 family metallopeptidase [Flavobacterium sp. SUN052]MEC4005564.1 M23 family metallopeptidase [Flavobacterium sp. SUN052]